MGYMFACAARRASLYLAVLTLSAPAPATAQLESRIVWARGRARAELAALEAPALFASCPRSHLTTIRVHVRADGSVRNTPPNIGYGRLGHDRRETIVRCVAQSLRAISLGAGPVATAELTLATPRERWLYHRARALERRRPLVSLRVLSAAGRDEEEMQAALRARQHEVRFCYQRLPRETAIPAALSFQLAVSADGRISYVWPDYSATGPVFELRSCISRRMLRGWAFEPGERATLRVELRARTPSPPTSLAPP